MIDHALTQAADWRPTVVGGKDGLRVASEIRQSDWVRDIRPFRPQIEARALAVLPAIVGALGMQRREVRQVDVTLVRHGDGAFYKQHIDTFAGEAKVQGQPERWITIVHYLHRRPCRFTGGALRMHAMQGADYMDIVPHHDLAVAFPSWIPHEVTPVCVPGDRPEDSRFAVNIWLNV